MILQRVLGKERNVIFNYPTRLKLALREYKQRGDNVAQFTLENRWVSPKLKSGTIKPEGVLEAESHLVLWILTLSMEEGLILPF